MTTMISNLPRDLIEEIISRVPWKSMKAVRSTCKSWNNLSKSESFTKIHIGKATRRKEGETMMITTTSHNHYLMSTVLNNVDPSVKLKGQLSLLNNQVSISQIYHFEGLVLCILKDFTRIVVWNPYWGQTRWIDLKYSHCPHGYDNLFIYALGYEDKESCRSVKFLRFLDYFCNIPEEQYLWYEIYDFDSGLWTTLDVNPHWSIWFVDRGVSVKGNTYWPAKERNSNVDVINHIICFDFTRERFGPLLPLPSSIRDHEYEIVTLSCIEEEKLAALFQHHASYKYEFEIWITTKIEVEMVSWSKFLRMDTEPKIGVPISFFIDEEKKLFMHFNRDYPNTYISIIGEVGYLNKLDIGVVADQECYPYVCSYVPSLVQIKNLHESKRDDKAV